VNVNALPKPLPCEDKGRIEIRAKSLTPCPLLRGERYPAAKSTEHPPLRKGGMRYALNHGSSSAKGEDEKPATKSSGSPPAKGGMEITPIKSLAPPP